MMYTCVDVRNVDNIALYELVMMVFHVFLSDFLVLF